tara:strand:+ start:27 stop:398 length:372 start_codon:yes stop_codon:yes gene_type:complete
VVVTEGDLLGKRLHGRDRAAHVNTEPIDASRLASRCKHPVAVEARGGARRNGPWQAQYCRVGREPMLSKLFEASPRARKGAALWAQPWQHNPREEHQANGHESTLKAESHVGAWHGSQRQINE